MTVLRRSTLVTLSFAGALALSACSQGGSSTNPTPTADKPATSESAPSDPASQVESPLNLKAVSDPCQLLKPEQLAQLGGGGEPKTEDATTGNKACVWSGESVSITVEPDTTTGGGFAGLRDTKANYANFEEIPKISGYPAARINRDDLLCIVGTGVSDEDTLFVHVGKFGTTDPQHADPCAFGEKVFTEVIKNVPPQG